MTDRAGLTAEQLAREFHNRYEQYAPSFGYETRKDTRAFDPTTPNGKLMIAVCANLIHSGLAGQAAASVPSVPTQALVAAIRLAQNAMRAPLDDWKGVLEAKALGACREALDAHAAPTGGQPEEKK